MAIADVMAGIRRQFGKFLGSTLGNATMITTIAAIPMIGSVGLAVDYMRGVRAAEALQTVADAAALAAASAKNVSGTTLEQLSQRAAIATNFINDSVANVSDIELVGSPQVTTGPNTIDIQVNAKVKGSFINVLNAIKDDGAALGDGSLGTVAGDKSKDINLSVHSKVGFKKEGYLCLLALDKHMKEALYFQGTTDFTSNCSVHANSDNEIAIRTWGDASATANSFCARGGWTGSGFVPTPSGGCPYVPDPFNNKHYVMPMPAVAASCDPDHTNVKVKNNDEMAILYPGTYCGGISVAVHGKATLKPGIFVLKDGKLNVDSQSELYAPDGTVIYLTGDSSYVDIMSGATVQITGPNKGNSTDETKPYRGWAILQDRTTGVGNTNTIYSKGGVDIHGGIYAPSQNLIAWANGDMNSHSSYFVGIVNSLNMNGTAKLYMGMDWEKENLDEPLKLKQAARVYVSQ